MANEQRVIVRYESIKGNFRHVINPGVVQFDQAVAEGGNPGIVGATTAWATVSFGDSTPGYTYIRNTSTAATVQFRTTSGGVWGQFKPGKLGLLPKGTNDWQVRASTAGGTANVDIRGFST